MKHVNAKGVTIIEMMIAIVIGSIIMIGVGTVYTSTKRSYKIQQEYARLQENGRFALNYMARFIRGAGYSGCTSGLDSLTNDLNNPDAYTNNFNTGLEGYEATGTGAGQTKVVSNNPSPSTGPATDWVAAGNVNIPADMVDGSADAVVPGSDVLTARSADGSGVEISTNNSSAQIFLTYTGTEVGACPDGTDRVSGLCDGDILMISDCQKAIVFQATNVQKAAGGAGTTDQVNVAHSAGNVPGNAKTSWGGAIPDPERTFKKGDEILRVSTKTFYVGKGKNGPALFIKRGLLDGTELVEGIETLQVLYGEDTDAQADNIPNRFVTADQVSDFANVVAVKLSILLASPREIPGKPADAKTYLLTGTTGSTGVTIDPANDSRFRRVMSMTVKLRNRAFSL